ncbi:hypothetical protein K0M31_002952 [Melipona bicolor]|uniref:CHK kinase-like domain-containing protein n=1 Tax=Melipona bicolor TaxID=60889 RepID=A0AA40G0J4_9HYME|nr:hypothetical protein K0M31_002952 [Melipona bicolor]
MENLLGQTGQQLLNGAPSSVNSHELLKRSFAFIEQKLLPEMVNDRCFCEPNSREFVEFDSATIRLVELSRSSQIYRVNIVVRFSGEPSSFPLLVKLLPEDGTEHKSPMAFDAYQNEEMFYSKMTRNYGTDLAPKCYLSDLGRYGRPVIVLEDLQEAGYEQVDDEMDEDHLKLCVQVLAKFHARGLRLRATEPQIFREFEAKLLEISLTDEIMSHYEKRSTRMLDILESMPNSGFAERVKQRLNKRPMEIVKGIATEVNDVSTICHGHFSHDNLLFKYEREKPIDVKVIDWQTMRYCSPGVDLGPILLYNVTHENGPSEVQKILTLYVDTVRSEYPEIDAKRLREDIVGKFLFACVVLSFLDHITDDELTRVLLLLEQLDDLD